ncbi:hypothetical protein [Mycolicibacter sinensis]|nr:hypothetical protein [Mycolicibacter sinensis]
MEKTTSRKLARTRLLERQRAEAAAREARERANLTDLTEFMVQTAHLEQVDERIAERIEKVKAEGEQRRHRYRVAAGKALHAMRMRGESVAAIARQTGLSQGQVREFVRIGAEADAAAVDGSPGNSRPSPVPSDGGAGLGEQPSTGDVGDAQ